MRSDSVDMHSLAIFLPIFCTKNRDKLLESKLIIIGSLPSCTKVNVEIEWSVVL